MVLALALHWMSWRWTEAVIKLGVDSPGSDFFFTLCVAINFPIAAIRAIISSMLTGYWDPALFILGIGLLWYWVMLNIEKWNEHKEIVLFQYLPLRFFSDIFFFWIGCACVCGLISDFTNRSHGGLWLLHFSPYFLTKWQVVIGNFVVEFLLFAWAFVLITVFGYDMIRTIRRIRSVSAKP
jgi:hypothetical protein